MLGAQLPRTANTSFAFVSAVTTTSMALACKNPIASLAVMLSNPTMIPASTSVTAIHSCISKNPTTTASITPMRNAQLPMRLPCLFLAIFFVFTSLVCIVFSSVLSGI